MRALASDWDEEDRAMYYGEFAHSPKISTSYDVLGGPEACLIDSPFLLFFLLFFFFVF